MGKEREKMGRERKGREQGKEIRKEKLYVDLGKKSILSRETIK